MKVVIVVLALSFASAAFADKPKFGDSFNFALGGMKQYGEARFSTGSNEGLDLEELGLADNTETVWGRASWRFTDRWEAGLSYSGYNSNGSNFSEKDFELGGIEGTIGALVESDFDMKLYIIDLSWDFVLSEKAHAGVGLGLHVMDLSLDVDATIDIDAGGNLLPEPISLGSHSGSATAPLPNISAQGGYTFGEKVYLGAKLGYFSLEYDKYDGSLTSVRLDAEWRPWKNFGLGLGYQYVDVDLKVDETDFKERYNIEFNGPILFLSVGF